MDKRVLFKTYGSFEIGFGHIRRCKSLADEMAGRIPPENISFFCDCPDPAIVEFFLPFASTLKKDDPREIIDFLRMNHIDILVIDEMKDHRYLTRRIKEQCPDLKIVCLDYLEYENPHVDEIINLINHREDVSSPAEIFGGVYHEGLQYALIRKEFFPYMARDREALSSVETILVTFGGADMKGHTRRVLEEIKALRFPGTVNVVCGRFFRGYPAIEKVCADSGLQVTMHRDTNEMPRLMAEADLAVTGAGTSIMELCAVGTPSIILPQNARERRFALSFQDRDAAFVVEEDQQIWKDMLYLIDNTEVRAAISSNARALVDGDGLRRMADRILSGGPDSERPVSQDFGKTTKVNPPDEEPVVSNSDRAEAVPLENEGIPSDSVEPKPSLPELSEDHLTQKESLAPRPRDEDTSSVPPETFEPSARDVEKSAPVEREAKKHKTREQPVVPRQSAKDKKIPRRKQTGTAPDKPTEVKKDPEKTSSPSKPEMNPADARKRSKYQVKPVWKDADSDD